MDQLEKTNKVVAKALGRRGFLFAAGATLLYGAGAYAAPATSGLATPLGAKYAVKTVDKVSLMDPSRGRTFLLRAYYPEAPGNYPTIIFSHGFGADMSAFDQTSRDWAARGYVIVHPTHADSFRYPDPAAPPGGKEALLELVLGRKGPLRRLRSGQNGDATLAALLENPFYLSSRLADIAFVVSLLDAGSGIDNNLHARVRRGGYGMAGHSLGAYTSEVIAGARLATPERNPSPSLMAKFSAVMAVSSQGSGSMDLTPDSFGAITRPFFAITGTEDWGLSGDTPEWRLEPYYKCAPGNKFAAVVQDFNHLSFDTQGEGSKALRLMQMAFWDAYLAGDWEAGNKLLAAAKRSTSADTVWLRTR
jgi:pimeloyl-ACP methyl ester carboxylesterase